MEPSTAAMSTSGASRASSRPPFDTLSAFMTEGQVFGRHDAITARNAR
jgi:hypothetical protein